MALLCAQGALTGDLHLLRVVLSSAAIRARLVGRIERLGGFRNACGCGFDTSANVFGGAEISRVISLSMRAGQVVIVDWSRLQLAVRDSDDRRFGENCRRQLNTDHCAATEN